MTSSTGLRTGWPRVYALYSCVEAVPTSEIGGISYLEVSSLPPPSNVEDFFQTFFSTKQDTQVPSFHV